MTAKSAEKAPEDAPKKEIELGLHEVPRTSMQRLQRTADYAEDPLAYLNKTLGPDIVESRRKLLSIPETLPLQNDFYGSGAHKDSFEQHIATLFGKKHGLFFLTGVQAQSVTCKIYSIRLNNPLVAWHTTAHLETAEQSAVTTLFGLRRALLGSDANSLPTVPEMESIAKLPQDERPAMILLEIPNSTLGCETYTFSELTQISRICKDANIALHCDGARIWEIEPYYKITDGKSFVDIAALFDSIYVSFYKGLRGSSGAMLLSDDAEFMLSARIWQRRAGGNPYTSMYELIDCERGFNENIGTFEGKWIKLKEIVNAIRQASEKYQKDGQAVVTFTPRSPTCCIVFIYLHGYSTNELNAARDRVLQKTGVKVFGRVRRVEQKKQTLDDILQQKWKESLKISIDNTKVHSEIGAEEPGLHKTALVLYAAELLSLETSVFVDAWINLCEELLMDQQS
jgi:Beta-eliminating lyase